ncbi:MAG: 2-C-methyl-D-erythritol 4-phosphate cytidylyltransferase [Dehalococcoidia bacterium]|nr:2-C-methyl-D-erythritol 4-phosphate cytidylyltransferase [Dehalococcoidia bacterium]
MRAAAVVVAAGSSTRFGGDKLVEDLCGIPVLARSLVVLQSCPSLGEVIVVTADERRQAIEEWQGRFALTKLSAIVPGGARRRDSVAAGLAACRTRYAAVHDGARPLVTVELVERTIAGAEGRAGAIAAVPVTDTIKEVRGGLVAGHPDRGLLWSAQTPQVFLRQAWLDAARAGDDDETDDAAMLARLGLACAVVEGDPANIKITRPLDLLVARAILASRENGR